MQDYHEIYIKNYFLIFSYYANIPKFSKKYKVEPRFRFKFIIKCCYQLHVCNKHQLWTWNHINVLYHKWKNYPRKNQPTLGIQSQASYTFFYFSIIKAVWGLFWNELQFLLALSWGTYNLLITFYFYYLFGSRSALFSFFYTNTMQLWHVSFILVILVNTMMF